MTFDTTSDCNCVNVKLRYELPSLNHMVLLFGDSVVYWCMYALAPLIFLIRVVASPNSPNFTSNNLIEGGFCVFRSSRV